MITEEDAARSAYSNFLSGYNCAQAVLEVFCEELGVDKDIALRGAQPFGGGTCRLREMCGTVSGMLLSLGFFRGVPDSRDKAAKDALYRDGQRLAGEFKEENGSYICRELLGLAPLGQSGTYLRENVTQGDPSSPVSEERTAEYYKKRPCPALCASAARIFARYLNERKTRDAVDSENG